MLMKCYHNTNDWENLKELTQMKLKSGQNDSIAKSYYDIAVNKKSTFDIIEEEILRSPTPEKYLDLSLKYFKSNRFEDCISAANKALELQPKYAEAYNNIGIANFHLKEYQKSILAYQSALKLKPNYILAQNNLRKAQETLKNPRTNNKKTETAKVNEFINLSLQFYNEGNYEKCIEAAQKSIAIAKQSFLF